MSHRFISAARAWREFQCLDSRLDQKTDVRLRVEAEVARQLLLTQIDGLENIERDGTETGRLLALAPELYAALRAIAERIDAGHGSATWTAREHSALEALLTRALPPAPLVPDKCPRCQSVRGYCACEHAYND